MSQTAKPPIQRLLTPITLTIDGRVISKKNSKRIVSNYRTGRAFLISSKGYESFKDDAVADLTAQMYQLKTQGHDFPLAGPYKLTCNFLLKGKSTTDLDNMLASVCDILQDAGIIDDDKDVLELHATKKNNAPDYKTTVVIASP